MTQSNNDIEHLQSSFEQQKITPSTGEIYSAYSTLQQLETTEPWAFGDKIRRKDIKYTAKAVLQLAGTDRVKQILANTREWLAEKEM